jgi:hypothetical protein
VQLVDFSTASTRHSFAQSGRPSRLCAVDSTASGTLAAIVLNLIVGGMEQQSKDPKEQIDSNQSVYEEGLASQYNTFYGR